MTKKIALNARVPAAVFDAIEGYRKGMPYHDQFAVVTAAILAFLRESEETRQCLIQAAVHTAHGSATPDWEGLVEMAAAGDLCGEHQRFTGAIRRIHKNDGPPKEDAPNPPPPRTGRKQTSKAK